MPTCALLYPVLLSTVLSARSLHLFLSNLRCDERQTVELLYEVLSGPLVIGHFSVISSHFDKL